MNNGKAKIIVTLVGVVQAMVMAFMVYWSTRVDANTDATSQNAVNIGRLEAQLNGISRQLDRIEDHLTEDHNK